MSKHALPYVPDWSLDGYTQAQACMWFWRRLRFAYPEVEYTPTLRHLTGFPDGC